MDAVEPVVTNSIAAVEERLERFPFIPLQTLEALEPIRRRRSTAGARDGALYFDDSGFRRANRQFSVLAVCGRG